MKLLLRYPLVQGSLFLVLVVTASLLMANSAGRDVHSACANQESQQDTAKATQAPFNQDSALKSLTAMLAGREKKPTEEVFKNIRLLKGMPTGRLLKIMEFGYSRSLGVTCTHCHNPKEWDSDEKPAKQITREMAAMAAAINDQYLKNIKNLKGPSPLVNCTTCHRGQVKPALDLSK